MDADVTWVSKKNGVSGGFRDKLGLLVQGSVAVWLNSPP